jgi:hypothetical protein
MSHSFSAKKSRKKVKNTPSSNIQRRQQQRQREEDQRRATCEDRIRGYSDRLRSTLECEKYKLIPVIRKCELDDSSINRFVKCLNDMWSALRYLEKAKVLRDKGGDIQKIAVMFIRASSKCLSSLKEYEEIGSLVDGRVLKTTDDKEMKDAQWKLNWAYTASSSLIHDELKRYLYPRANGFFTPITRPR